MKPGGRDASQVDRADGADEPGRPHERHARTIAEGPPPFKRGSAPSAREDSRGLNIAFTDLDGFITFRLG
jgi:hypothetical protein